MPSHMPYWGVFMKVQGDMDTEFWTGVPSKSWSCIFLNIMWIPSQFSGDADITAFGFHWHQPPLLYSAISRGTVLLHMEMEAFFLLVTKYDQSEAMFIEICVLDLKIGSIQTSCSLKTNSVKRKQYEPFIDGQEVLQLCVQLLGLNKFLYFSCTSVS